jgi:hypothetical protein
MGIEFRTREQWGARDPVSVAMHRRVSRGLVAHHTTGATIGDPDYDQWVRNIQNFHMDTKQWADIAYSFLITPHGVVYEGRGWGVTHAGNYDPSNAWPNFGTHSVALLGMGDDPRVFTPAVKVAFRELISIHQYIQGPCALNTHRRIAVLTTRTVCPGTAFGDWVEAGALIDDPQAAIDQGLRDFYDAVQAGQIVQLTDGQWVWAHEAQTLDNGQVVHRAHAVEVLPGVWVHDSEAPAIVEYLRSQGSQASAPAAPPPPSTSPGPATSTPIPPPTTFEEDLVAQLPMLAQGDEGFAVKRAQALLSLFGTNLKTDGMFGPKTEARVRQVQERFELAVDGIIGPNTWTALVTEEV